MTSPILFVFAILILLFTPGPTNTLLWASGAMIGIRRSLPLLLGEIIGYFSAIMLILLLFEPMLQHVPHVERVLAVAVGCYVTHLAVTMWRCATDSVASTAVISFKKIVIVTFLNPKAFIFALTLIPSGDAQSHWYFVMLAICITTVGFSWIVFGYLVGSATGRKNMALFNRFSSVMLTGFAGFMLFSALH